MKVIWAAWKRLINEKFIPLTECSDRYVILYGSRGSSKSDYIAKQLVYNCISHKYFKCILYRKNFNTIQESSYENIKQTINSLGLQKLFTCLKSPLQIICVNGNKFIARGGDDPQSLKSIKDPTCVWYEEDIPDEEDFATITLTIRSGKADNLQEYFSINPEVEGDFTDNWFWKRFFKDHNAFSYRTTTNVEVEGRQVEYSVTVHHSTYQDNRWLPDAVKAQIESYKNSNEYLYSVYAKGLWTRKQTGGNFYKLFQRSRDTVPAAYNPMLPLHISFDFNVNPYMTLTIWQFVGKKGIQIDEICAETPNNSTPAICRLFYNKYFAHKERIFYYGDPAGRQKDTRHDGRDEKGYNDFTIIRAAISKWSTNPGEHVALSAPPVAMRGNFINEILLNKYDGIELTIGNNCGKTISDYMYLKEASDGTKAKEKVKHPDTNVTYEKYGHTSDANDYLLCFMFANEFLKYQRGGMQPKITIGKNVSRNKF